MNTQHIPGPWSFDHAGRGDLQIKGANNECVVSGCGCCDSPFGDNLAHDARLIAASPDLLKALQGFFKNSNRNDWPADIYDAAGEAITKATGEQP